MMMYAVEMVLVLTVFVVLSAGLFIRREKNKNYPGYIAGWILTFVAFFIWKNISQFGFPVVLMISSSVIVYTFSFNWLIYKNFSTYEFSLFYLMNVLGQIFALKSTGIIGLFLGMELAQIALLSMVAYKKYGMRSTQAGIRFFSMSFLSSGLFLTGAGILYTLTGTFEYHDIALFFKTQAPDATALMGVGFLTLSLLIKLGIPPFHLWFVDVCEGAPSPITSFLGITWRATLLLVFAILIKHPLEAFDAFFKPVLAVVTVLTLIIGAFGEERQENIKRLTAYTVLCENGYSLIALMTGNITAFVFLLIIETVLLTGLFAVMLSLRTRDVLNEELSVLKGKGKNNPLRGFFFSIIFIGLTGLPPFAGFWGYFFVLKEAVLQGFFVVTAIALGAIVMQSYVYSKAVRLMYTDFGTSDDFDPVPHPMRRVVIFSVIFASAFVFVVLPLWQVALNARM